MNQDLVTIIQQAEKEAENQFLFAQEEAKKLLAKKDKEMEAKMNQLRQSLESEIGQIEATAQQTLLEIERKEKEKTSKFQSNNLVANQAKAKKFILDFIAKQLWLQK